MDYQELHRSALVIDGHNDTIVAHIGAGSLSVVRGAEGFEQRHQGTIAHLGAYGHEQPGEDHTQFDLRRMRAGGIDVAFCAIDVTPAFEHHLAYTLDGFGYLLNDLDRSGAQVTIVRSVADIERAHAAGLPALLLAVENADCTERSLNILRALYELGVRAIGLTHNLSSWAADGVGESRPGVGLTRYGVGLVREMNRLGMVVDLAHVSESAFYHALEVSEKPVVFSHGNAKALCDHRRNLSDAQLVALARAGGVIGLSFVPPFVDAANPTLERWLDHVDHVVAVAGIEAVGLGSDFDGGGTLLPEAGELPRITEGLLRRGYDADAVRAILGGNFLRVLRATIG